MMGAFALALILSAWKLYKFMPNKQLEDDDNTKESVDQLTFIMIDTIQTSSTPPTHKELFILIKSHSDFDEKHFWRFNENRLHQLLQKYYTIHNLSSIEEIHKKAVQE
jgi:hypothetical protein